MLPGNLICRKFSGHSKVKSYLAKLRMREKILRLAVKKSSGKVVNGAKKLFWLWMDMTPINSGLFEGTGPSNNVYLTGRYRRTTPSFLWNAYIFLLSI